MKFDVREYISQMGLGPILRLVGALLCFLIAIPLMILPGPAFVFFLIGLLLLGFSARDVVKFITEHTPGLSDEQAEKLKEHPWVKKIDETFGEGDLDEGDGDGESEEEDESKSE